MSNTSTKIGNWLNDTMNVNCFATITFRQCKHHDGGVREWVNAEIIQSACNEIMLRCVKKTKHISPSNEQKSLFWATFIEDGHGNKRLHAHIAISRPSHISFVQFSQIFYDLCTRFDWIDERVEIKEINGHDDQRRVLFYCLKEGVDAFQPNASRLALN